MQKQPFKGVLRQKCSENMQQIFEEDVKSKLKNANFIVVFCNGSTDSAVIEKECIYILFVEPFEFEPTLSSLS